MSDERQDQQNLTARIKAKRDHIAGYLATAKRRGNRLTTTSIICGVFAGLLTVGPAFGGRPFTRALTAMIGSSQETNPSWRILCAAATVLSIIAAVAIAIYRSENIAVHVAKAQIADIRLEELAASLELGTITVSKATELYDRVISEVAFIPCRDETD